MLDVLFDVQFGINERRKGTNVWGVPTLQALWAFGPLATGPVGEFEFADRARTRRPEGPAGPKGPQAPRAHRPEGPAGPKRFTSTKLSLKAGLWFKS